MIPGVPDFGVGPVPEPGRVDEVAPGVRRLTAPNPGLMTGPGTNTYLVGDSEPVVVDPGPADPAHTEAIVAAAAPLGPIRSILVTHTHVDHAPGAAALAAATGARVVGFAPAEGFEPDECVGEGWSVSAPLSSGPSAALTLRALHTPGHASDHLCWLVEEHALLLTGDHVMHGSTVVIRPPDADLHQYLDSLARVRDEVPPIRTLGPGHGRLMDHVPDVIDALVAHRRGRHERVAEVLTRRGDGTVDDLLEEVYGDVTEQQLPVARFSLWAHLRALAQEGRAKLVSTSSPAVSDGGLDTIESRWAA
ncbi:MAG TPA: MBL fold metallo-hydrolase [Acidimicrobiales bacterium]|nr:MBL fold metallo-hydrolase [Acidimicrobiales bacterium]